MAEHKVPQDVEAEDKLIGPLSFRQFIYAMIALAAAALAYFLATMVAMPLLVIPLPVFIVFGVLAVPRKGQPMETYIGALIHFYFQPTKRIWDPDGQELLVEITNPPIDTIPLTKSIGGAEAAQRLSFLADVEDSQGWSTRGNVNLYDDFALEANAALDVFEDTSLNQEFGEKLAAAEQRVHDEAVANMNIAATTPVGPGGFAPPAYTPPAAIVTPPPTATPALPVDDEASLSAMLKQSSASSPMTAFHQTVVQPLGASPVADNPTLTTTAAPTTPAPMPTTTPTAPEPVSTPVPPPPALMPLTPTPEPPQPEPAPAETVAPKPATIESREREVELVQAPPSEETTTHSETSKADSTADYADNVADTSVEEVISHDGEANDNQGGEISLH